MGTFALWWNGAFNKFIVREIVSYKENGYTLIFQQLGDPQWPFGSTEVRLILKNQQGKVINKYDTSIQDDGTNAGERNIASVEWLADKVIVVLQVKSIIFPTTILMIFNGITIQTDTVLLQSVSRSALPYALSVGFPRY